MSTATNLKQEIGLPLDCQIKTESEYQLGQAITVTGVIHNAGASAVWISRRNTFLEKNWGNCLSVTHNGSPVDYVGIAITTIGATTEPYLKILAGESVEGQIDLSEHYAITEPGDYEASFDLHIEGAFDYGDAEPAVLPHRLQLTIITSDNAAFRMKGDAALQPKKAVTPVIVPEIMSADSFPGTPKNPTFEGMTPDEKKAILWAHVEAYTYILGALKGLEKVTESADTQFYGEWLEARSIGGWKEGWKERLAMVKRNFSNMASWMSTSSVMYKKTEENCTSDTIAWTYINQRAAVNFCSLAFNVHFMRLIYWRELNWMLPFIIIHEVSHAAGNVLDKQYSWYLCQQLAVYNPAEAVNNAQSYALFAMGQLDVPKLNPLEKLKLKTGDKITLSANNGNFLMRVNHPSWGDYIEAARSDMYTVFTVTVTGSEPIKLLLQADNGWYCSWNDNGGYIMTNKQTPDQYCYFTPGEFADELGNVYLALMAINDQILSVITAASGYYIMAAKPQIDPWCLFFVRKQ
ncbi:MAG TPA: M35 family metallo-endopeptidase [Pyrinomonadaceae bacterium]|jgi:hypothetical protein